MMVREWRNRNLSIIGTRYFKPLNIDYIYTYQNIDYMILKKEKKKKRDYIYLNYFSS